MDFIDAGATAVAELIGQDRWDHLVNEVLPKEAVQFIVKKLSTGLKPIPKSGKTGDVDQLWRWFFQDVVKAMFLVMRAGGNVSQSQLAYLKQQATKRNYVSEDGESLEKVISDMALVPYNTNLFFSFMCNVVYNYKGVKPDWVREDFYARMMRLLFYAACGGDDMSDWDQDRFYAMPQGQKTALLIAARMLVSAEDYADFEKLLVRKS